MKGVIVFWIFMVFASITAQNITEDKPLGIVLEKYSYPYTVDYIELTVQNQPVKMAYMDLKPAGYTNGQTVLLLHGKNFFGAYWHKTIQYLTEHGYRVVVPDQIGFGKSSKPSVFYSFHLLAENTKALLDRLEISNVAVVGHSMGAMLATRFVLMYPERATHLVLENPLGLEDYKLKVPYTSVEKYYQKELKKTEEEIRNEHKTYYVSWKEEYEEYVQAQYRVTLSPEYSKLAWVNALTTEMIYTQPVAYEFPNIQVPTTLIMGEQANTTIEKDLVPDSLKHVMESYSDLGRNAVEIIPDARIITFENTGHIPHIEASDRFNRTLIQIFSERGNSF